MKVDVAGERYLTELRLGNRSCKGGEEGGGGQKRREGGGG